MNLIWFMCCDMDHQTVRDVAKTLSNLLSKKISKLPQEKEHTNTNQEHKI